MYKFCTLFDSNYLTRGLTNYESLKKHCKCFHLYIFAFDSKCYSVLTKLKLEFVTIISLKEFEDEELLRIKAGRTVGEYCWTCTPSIIKYCIEYYDLDSCTYIDADLYFFRDPTVLIDEMGSNSVLITEHRYSVKYNQVASSGIYCVQFMTFKNNKEGMGVLSWWRDSCIEWCYARFEDGKFGDQKYLDDWTTRFNGIHVLEHLGGGVAPWNIQQYDLSKDGGFKLIFYHFHDFKYTYNGKVDMGAYKLRKTDIDILYTPYANHMEKVAQKLNQIEPLNTFDGSPAHQRFSFKTILKYFYRKINGTYNVVDKKDLLKA